MTAVLIAGRNSTRDSWSSVEPAVWNTAIHNVQIDRPAVVLNKIHELIQ